MFDGYSHYYDEEIIQFQVLLWELLTKYKKITLVCHNAKYDFQLLKLLENFITSKKLLGLHRKKMILGSVNYVKFSSLNNALSISFLDSTNYFKVSLSELGEAIGLKKEDESDYKLTAKEWNKKLPIMAKPRVQKDTEILYEFFTEFLKMPGLIFGITSASTAFKTFRKYFLKYDISLPKELIDPALASYRGARVEPYKFYPTPVKRNYYDINSLYPKVMRDNKYSVKFRRKIEVNEISLEEIAKGTYNYLIKCNYQYQDKPLRIPVVIKNNNNDRLIQSYSGQNVWLTGKEILAMAKQNVVIQFLECYEFFAENIFSEYVDHYYNLRKQTTNQVWNLFYKVGMLNSLYGKFGQHKRITKYKSVKDLDEIEEIAYKIALKQNKKEYVLNGKYISIHDGYLTEMEELPEEQLYNPLIASEITANARLYNYEMQVAMGVENVDYTDTDSFMTDRILETSTELGKLKLEMTGIFTFYDAKDYEYFGICTHKNCVVCNNKTPALHSTLKGIRKDAYFDVENNRYIQRQFSSFKSSQKIGMVQVKNISKVLSRKRKKLRYVKNQYGEEIGYPYESQNTDIDLEIKIKKR